MKIIYTNLQENDAGVLRSVRQLRVDFDRNGRGEARFAHGGERGWTGRDNSLLLSHADLSDLGRRPTKRSHTPSAGNEEDKALAGSLQEGASPTFRDSRAVAHLLVRRFVEAQLRSARSFEIKSRINITV
jgi:hypothetical protein